MATIVTQTGNDLQDFENQLAAATTFAQLKTAMAKLIKVTRRIKKRQDRIISEIKALKNERGD